MVETAPAIGLPADLTKTLYDDAVRICRGAGYVNAGTVEFLVDPKTWKHYFIEVNPRIQVRPAAPHAPTQRASSSAFRYNIQRGCAPGRHPAAAVPETCPALPPLPPPAQS